MGGKLFNADRMSKDIYLEVQQHVVSFLESQGIVALEVYQVGEKTSFGDLDLVVESHPNSNIDLIVQYGSGLGLFLEKERVLNGNALSLKIFYKGLNVQVDLIQAEPDKLEVTRSYLSYGDVGMVLGRMADSMSMKLGFNGLYYKYKNPDFSHVREDFFLCDQWSDILHFFGYSYADWYHGFSTYRELYLFLVSSPYFSAKVMHLENIGHKRRLRQKKRDSYRKFLEFCRGHKARLEPMGLEEIDLCYPGVKYRKEAKDLSLLRQKDLKKKFNGNIVHSLIPCLSGKPLGDFVKHLRAYMDEEFVLHAKEEEISRWILEEWEDFGMG